MCPTGGGGACRNPCSENMRKRVVPPLEIWKVRRSGTKSSPFTPTPLGLSYATDVYSSSPVKLMPLNATILKIITQPNQSTGRRLSSAPRAWRTGEANRSMSLRLLAVDGEI